MRITGETMIYANNFNERLNYSTTISKKNENGEYENMFIPVKFKGGAGVPNKTKINIQDGFMSFYKNNTGLEKVQIIVMNYDVKLPAEEFTNQFGGLVTDEDSLPF